MSYLLGDFASKLTEVLDVDTLEWQQGFDLPNNLGYAGHVDFEDTTLIIGGWDGYRYYDKILIWDPDTLSWSEMEEKTSIPIDRTCAVLVDESKVNCD